MAHKVYILFIVENTKLPETNEKVQKSYIQVNSRVRESESKACLWLCSSTCLELESLEYQGGDTKYFCTFYQNELIFKQMVWN